jgi:uncharacterized membrane protein
MQLVLALVFAIGGVICHQRPERSFFVDGYQFPVCARCTGLYLSGALALLSWWSLKAGRQWRPMPMSPDFALRLVVLAAIPTLISLAGGALSVWDGSNLTRAALAIPLGASAGAIVAAVTTKDLR